MHERFVGIDATQLPLTVRVSHIDEQGEWVPCASNVRMDSSVFRPTCSSVSIPDPSRWENAANHLDVNSVTRLTDRDLQAVNADLDSFAPGKTIPIARVAVAHPALLPPSAIEHLVARIAKALFPGTMTRLDRERVIPIAAPLAMTLSELAPSSQSSFPREIVTCTPGLAAPVTARESWCASEWCQFLCEPRKEGRGYRLHPLWFCSEVEALADVPGIDDRDCRLPVHASQRRGTFLSFTDATRERYRQWHEADSSSAAIVAPGRVDPAGVAAGASAYAAVHDSRLSSTITYELMRPIPLPLGVLCSIGTEVSSMMWREILSDPSTAANWALEVNSSHIFLAALHGFASATQAAPRWLPVNGTLPPEQNPWAYFGAEHSRSSIGVKRDAHLVEVRRDRSASWSALRFAVSPGHRPAFDQTCDGEPTAIPPPVQVLAGVSH